LEAPIVKPQLSQEHTMTEFDDMERKSSYQVDERTFQDELELEKLAEGVVRANRLQRAFEERLKARTKAREEEAEMKAEAARLAYEQAVKNLEDVRRYNAFLELKSKHPGFSYDSYSLDHEGILLESEVLGQCVILALGVVH
jgi:predicted S18 family serine protease